MQDPLSGPDPDAARQRTNQLRSQQSCVRCTAIKATYYEAARQSDVQTAEAMTAAMGRHLRAAH